MALCALPIFLHYALTPKKYIKVVLLCCSIFTYLDSIDFTLTITQLKSQALTQAWRLLPLDLCQFGDGVRAVTLCEDARQLLADHLILTKHRQRNKTSEGEESCLGGQRSANIQEFMLRKNTSTYFSAPLSYTKHPQHNYQHSERGLTSSAALYHAQHSLISPHICGYLTPLKGDQINIRLTSHTESLRDYCSVEHDRPSCCRSVTKRKTTLLLCVWC